MGVEFIIWLQDNANRFFDLFFDFISFLGEEYVYIAILGLIYWTINKKVGAYIGIILGTTVTLNNVLKDFFSANRPFEDYPDDIINKRPETSTGHAMPSGHVQNAASFYTAVAIYAKRHFMLIIAIGLTLLMMLSRMYLGVHYFEDVIVGAVVGIGLSILMYWLFKKFKSVKQMRYLQLSLIVIFLPFFFIATSKDFFVGYGILIGLILAIQFEQKFVQFDMAIPLYKKALRYIIGMVFLVLILTVLSALFSMFNFGTFGTNFLDFARYLLVAFSGFGLYPYVFKKLKF